MKKINETRDDSRPLVDVRTKEEYDKGHLPGCLLYTSDAADEL